MTVCAVLWRIRPIFNSFMRECSQFCINGLRATSSGTVPQIGSRVGSASSPSPGEIRLLADDVSRGPEEQLRSTSSDEIEDLVLVTLRSWR